MFQTRDFDERDPFRVRPARRRSVAVAVATSGLLIALSSLAPASAAETEPTAPPETTATTEATQDPAPTTEPAPDPAPVEPAPTEEAPPPPDPTPEPTTSLRRRAHWIPVRRTPS